MRAFRYLACGSSRFFCPRIAGNHLHGCTGPAHVICVNEYEVGLVRDEQFGSEQGNQIGKRYFICVYLG